MKYGVLGTGMVGQALAGKLVALGHDVMMGSRGAKNPKAIAWARSAGPRALVGTFAEAAVFGELLFNCTHGASSVDALRARREKRISPGRSSSMSRTYCHQTREALNRLESRFRKRFLAPMSSRHSTR
jgi:3-hydroxyisobutyrate dehydrogenase-like beta-hydroxyacid dehydrogenase